MVYTDSIMCTVHEVSLLTNKMEPKNFCECATTKEWLLIVFQTNVLFSYDGQNYFDVFKNSIVLYPPGQLHAYKSNDETFLNSFMFLSADDAFFAAFRFPHNHVFSVSQEHINAIIGEMDRISYIVNTQSVPQLKKDVPAMIAFVFKCIEAAYADAEKNAPEQSTVRDFAAIRNKMQSDPVRYTVHKMALLSGYSKTYFGIKYKQFFGCNPCRDRKAQLVRVIKGYLETTDDSLEKIAERCNIESVSYLIHLFKTTEKITPHQYRLLHRRQTQT